MLYKTIRKDGALTLLNVSFGIYAFMPQGWLFMIFIVLLECVLLSYLLRNTLKNKRIYVTTTLSNFISGLIGFAISMALNGGWWLVVWLPWVSDNEVNLDKHFSALMIYYLVAFVMTLIVETLINTLMLKKELLVKKIIKSTVLTNIVSYLIGSIMLYSYSFG